MVRIPTGSSTLHSDLDEGLALSFGVAASDRKSIRAQRYTGGCINRARDLVIGKEGIDCYEGSSVLAAKFIGAEIAIAPL